MAQRESTRKIEDAEVVLDGFDLFAPSEDQQRLKDAFWASVADDPTFDRNSITLASAQQVLDDKLLVDSWSNVQFRAWFCNSSEWQQHIAYGARVALRTLMDVMEDPKAASNARVRAAEIVARLAAKEPPKTKEIKFADARIQKLEEPEQLRRFILQNSALMLKILKDAGQLPLGEASDESDERDN